MLSDWIWDDLDLYSNSIHDIFCITAQIAVWIFRPVHLPPSFLQLWSFRPSGAHFLALRISHDAETSYAPLLLSCSLWRSSTYITYILNNNKNYPFASPTFMISPLSHRTSCWLYSCIHQSSLKHGRYVQTFPWKLINMEQLATTSIYFLDFLTWFSLLCILSVSHRTRSLITAQNS